MPSQAACVRCVQAVPTQQALAGGHVTLPQSVPGPLYVANGKAKHAASVRTTQVPSCRQHAPTQGLGVHGVFGPPHVPLTLPQAV